MTKRTLTTTLAIALGILVASLSIARAGDAKTKRVAKATRVEDAPKIDGRLDDASWQQATWQGDFVQRRPDNGEPATLDTSFAVIFDRDAIYVGVRCLVDDPEEIVTRLTRRDRSGDFDMVSVTVSPRGDGRTGYSFTVNPDGVLRDLAWHGDTSSDSNWDALWRAETEIGDDAWTVEIAIPFDQMRFPAGRESWGLQVTRWSSARQELATFNPVPTEEAGWISAAGTLTGIEEVEPQLPISITPEAFASYRETTDDFSGRADEGFEWGVGGYAKVGLGPDAVLDVAVHPDFGQVEVDAAELNLSAYETTLPEKRPFFLEGAGIFSTPMRLFYSRRLGAPPLDPALEQDECLVGGPSATPILAATKLTGRSSSGLSVGLLESVLMPTEFRAQNTVTGEKRTVEGSPWTNVSALRLNTELGGNSSIGLMATALNPEDSNGSYTGGFDWNLITPDREFAFRGQAAGSLRFDGVPGKEASHGAGVWTEAGREGGKHLRLWGGYEAYSKGFDLNDLGYLKRDDFQHYWGHIQLRTTEPRGALYETYLGIVPEGSFNMDGLDLGQGLSLYLSNKWRNSWRTSVGLWGELARHDDRETRGGPPLPESASAAGWISVRTDPSKVVGGRLSVSSGTTEHGYHLGGQAALELRFGRLELDLGPSYTRSRSSLSYVGTMPSPEGEMATVIGRRDLDMLDLSLKGTLTILRDLTLQFSSQMLVAKGDYGHYERLLPGDGRAPFDYPDEYADFVCADLRLQALLRWEYLPGSALYLVYTHLGLGNVGIDDRTLRDGIVSLGNEEREQVFMIKLSHMFH